MERPRLICFLQSLILIHQRGGGELLGVHADHLLPLRFHRRCLLLHKHRTQSGSNHVLTGFWHFDQEVAGKVDPAALPAAAEVATDHRKGSLRDVSHLLREEGRQRILLMCNQPE